MSLTVKKLPDVEKKVEKFFKKINQKDWTKCNRKMGGRSFYIPSGGFGDTLQCHRPIMNKTFSESPCEKSEKNMTNFFLVFDFKSQKY